MDTYKWSFTRPNAQRKKMKTMRLPSQSSCFSPNNGPALRVTIFSSSTKDFPTSKRDRGPIKDDIIPMLPYGPTCKYHNFSEDDRTKALPCLYYHIKHGKINIPKNTWEGPASLGERAFKEEMKQCLLNSFYICRPGKHRNPGTCSSVVACF